MLITLLSQWVEEITERLKARFEVKPEDRAPYSKKADALISAQPSAAEKKASVRKSAELDKEFWDLG